MRVPSSRARRSLAASSWFVSSSNAASFAHGVSRYCDSPEVKQEHMFDDIRSGHGRLVAHRDVATEDMAE